jgi:hypothetical protein
MVGKVRLGVLGVGLRCCEATERRGEASLSVYSILFACERAEGDFAGGSRF